MALSADGRLALTSSWDRTALLWDVHTGKQLATCGGHTGSVRTAALSGDGRYVLTGPADGQAHLWDACTGDGARCRRGCF